MYDIHDTKAMKKHQGVLSMIILGLQPMSIVENPGFLMNQRLMDPSYEVASTPFYTTLLDKVLLIYVVVLLQKTKN